MRQRKRCSHGWVYLKLHRQMVKSSLSPPNGIIFHSAFHSRHTMSLPKARDFFACNHSCLQLFSCLFSFVTFFDVLISFFSIFCQQYFWSKITSRPSSLNFTSLAIFVAKLFANQTNFYLLIWSLWNFNKCKTSIRKLSRSSSILDGCEKYYLDRKSMIFNYLKWKTSYWFMIWFYLHSAVRW